MNRKLLILACLALAGCASIPEPSGALPTPAQVEWQKMETNMFVHFGPNTFSGNEWGNGRESEDLFNPSDLDCRQWARTALSAGFKGIIITAKHHDGFCLWPNPESTHTVAQSSWKDGKGDVLRELSEACAEYGLGFGVYISPWDRNDPRYGTDEYNGVFVRTLESALGNYGKVFEQWFDGACGEGPGGKVQVYDWPLFNGTVYSLQPDASIFSDVGPGCRWVGNEAGEAGRTSWSTLNITGFAPGKQSPPLDVLTSGEEFGEAWVPSETDVSIRPGWFWKESETPKVKSVDELLKIYYESVGRNSLLLLNVPADVRGRIDSVDSLCLAKWRAALDEIFSVNLASRKAAKAVASDSRGCRFGASRVLDGNYDTFWAASDDLREASLTVSFDTLTTFNRVLLQEYIPLGQRVESFTIEALGEGGEWKEIASETTIGYKRIVLMPTTSALALRVSLKASSSPTLSSFEVYNDTVYTDPSSGEASEFRICSSDEPVVFSSGEDGKLSSFTYVPAERGEGGVIITYDLYASRDGNDWRLIIGDGMFDNIVNNPIAQTVKIDAPLDCSFLKLVPIRTSIEGQYSLSSFFAE